MDERLEKLKGRIRMPEDRSDPRFWVKGPNGEDWYEVHTQIATTDDVVKMSELEPEKKPFVVFDHHLYKIRAGNLGVFIPELPKDTRVRHSTRKKIRLAAMTNTTLEDAGIAETPANVELYDRERASVVDMISRGIQPEIMIDATEALP